MISVHEYKAELKKTISDFSRWWDEKSRIDSKVYPELLSSEEWDEQFYAWITMKLENETI